VRTHSQAACADLGTVVSPTLVSTICSDLNPNVSSARVRVSASLGGSCSVQNNHSLPPPNWQTLGRACGGATPGGTCGSGQVCLPALPNGFESCVYQAGDVSCPSSYPQKQLFYDGASDTRSCSTCSCGNLTGTCEGTVGFSNSSSCGTATIVVDIGACTTGVSGTHAKYTAYQATGVACTPSNSTLSGSVTPTNPVTFCCE
jgi:hypothetical protein